MFFIYVCVFNVNFKSIEKKVMKIQQVVWSILLEVFLVVGGTFEEYSFISPHSLMMDNEDSVPNLKIQPTKLENNKYFPEKSSANNNDEILSKTSAGDSLILYKNIEDNFEGNDVQEPIMMLSARKIIQLSKTDLNGKSEENVKNSGEVRGALQGRSLEAPHHFATEMSLVTPSRSSDSPRQADLKLNVFIQKLIHKLNGNVNVQANSAPLLTPMEAGRPFRPLSTRINNRGPPRITDLPDLPPDFDKPLLPPPPGPMTAKPPYPFEMPPINVNITPKRPYGMIPLSERITTMNKEISSTEANNKGDILNLHLENQFSNIDDLMEMKPEKVAETPSIISRETETLIMATSTLSSSSSMTATTSILDIPISLVTEDSSSSSVQPLKTTITSRTTTSTILETSIPEIHPSISSITHSSASSSSIPESSSLSTSFIASATPSLMMSTDAFYKPRPGIVLDDPDYKPKKGQRPILAPSLSAYPNNPDIFDLTVSAIQGLGGGGGDESQIYPSSALSPVDILTSAIGNEGFVSIDGKRTKINLFGGADTTHNIQATAVHKRPPSSVKSSNLYGGEIQKTSNSLLKRPSHHQLPTPRIDTCIVGDETTCDISQREICRIEGGVSACHCRPGTGRRGHRDPCRKIISVFMSLRVDRVQEQRVTWNGEFFEKNNEGYETLSYQAEQALESAMSMTPFSDLYMGSKVNNIYQGDRAQGQEGVFVNLTVTLEQSAETSRPGVKNEIQTQLLGVIKRRGNNVGHSNLWVDSPPGAVTGVNDLDECASPELHDCHANARCENTFGTFHCTCLEGFRDLWAEDRHRAGRECQQCSRTHCNNRGECRFVNNLETCTCQGNYYGNQCELDGEVLGVAIGASLAAILIIGLTLVSLVMWSRKWSREQKQAVGSPVFGYMTQPSSTMKGPMSVPPYQMTLEDRVRWAQIADVMAQANHYAPEPGIGAPSCAASTILGYPTLPMNHNIHNNATMQRHPASLYGGAPVPLPRLNLQTHLKKASSVQSMRNLDNHSSSSEEEDKIDLLGRNFHVPRPKSRSNASVANQSGIYYDVDEAYNNNNRQNIPLKESSVSRKLWKNLETWTYEDFKHDAEENRHAGRSESPTTSL